MTMGRRKKRGGRAACHFGEGRQSLTACDGLLGANFQASCGWHHVLTLPSKACLDIAVRLVDWHENFLRILLSKAREVHQEAMDVRHLQFDVVDFGNF